MLEEDNKLFIRRHPVQLSGVCSLDPYSKQKNADLLNQFGEVLHGVGVGMAHPDRCLGQESALRLFLWNIIHSCLWRKEQQEVGLSYKEELG